MRKLELTCSLGAAKSTSLLPIEYFSGWWKVDQGGGAVAEWVRASTGDRTIDGSTPTAGDFEFGTLAIPLTLLCQCFSDDTLKAVGPFYLVSMPGEVKDPTSPHWNVSLVDSTSHSKSPVCEYAALDAALHSIRRRTERH